ncbi:MAG: hypothetical protein Q9220_002582 [cf. Caloplaca sp. 1 TL-2023]
MAPIRIPETGLLLERDPSSTSDHDPSSVDTQPQVMRLDLADGVLEDIEKASRMCRDIHLSFGKNITLHYGNRSQQLLSITQPTPSELYTYSPDQEGELRFAGTVTHKLAQKKVQETTAGADAALAALQSKMASHQQTKQSKQIKVLSQTLSPSPIIKSSRPQPKASNFLSALKGQPPKKAIPALTDKTVRSMPTSPALTSNRQGPTTSNAPTSAPAALDVKSQKLQALRIPLLHLVAIRPMSLKFLANKVGCSQEECKQVLEKIGRPARLDPEKWDLSDKAFKDLNVWAFAYESDDDRELAIEHAVSAYDRMRLSRDDKLWQMLLSKEERGKGKILSKLQLHQGPIQKSNTPRIHVQRTTEDQVNDNAPHIEASENNHLAPADATPKIRSQTGDQIKKKRVSEQEAQAKRLLASKPKKDTMKGKETTRKNAVKKGGPSAPAVKSSEFVHDSDEDIEMEDVPQAAKSTTKKPAEQDVSAKPKETIQNTKDSAKESRQVEKEKAPNPPANQKRNGKDQSPSTTSTPTSKHRLSDASQSSSSSSKLSRQRTTSSPLKPSPLGSSPPTNASDLENDGHRQLASNSSTSSTPLVTQSRSTPINLIPRSNAAKRLPIPAGNQPQPSSKRKAEELESSIHCDGVRLTNGHITPANKRSKTSVPTPPATISGSSSESSPISDDVLGQAQRFKEYYANYERYYQEVSSQKNATAEKIDRLVKMHRRLQSMKDEIARATVHR